MKNAATQAIVENYREMTFQMQKYPKIQMYRYRNDAQKFCQKLKHLTEGFKLGTFYCKDENGNLVTDT